MLCCSYRLSYSTAWPPSIINDEQIWLMPIQLRGGIGRHGRDANCFQVRPLSAEVARCCSMFPPMTTDVTIQMEHFAVGKTESWTWGHSYHYRWTKMGKCPSLLLWGKPSTSAAPLSKRGPYLRSQRRSLALRVLLMVRLKQLTGALMSFVCHIPYQSGGARLSRKSCGQTR